MTPSRFTSRFLVLLVIAFVAGCAVSPPVQEMSNARQAIAAAADAEAVQLAPGALDEALRYLDEAEAQIRDRLFNLARANAIRAKNSAVDALLAVQAASRSADN